MTVLGFHCCGGSSLVATSEGCSVVVVCGLLVEDLLLLQSMGFRCVGSVGAAPGFWNTGSVVVAHGLSCFSACGIFPDQGLTLCLLH